MYSFKHALTQDVVYAGVLERRRRTYHAAAGLGLEELYAGRIDDVVELIAYHFGRGQVWDKAATYFRQAAVKAQAKSAHREALASLEEALEALRHLPETPRDARARDRCAPRAPRLALPARRVREDAGPTCGKPRPWPARSPIPAGSGWSPSTPPNTSARRGGSPRRERLPRKRWPWATSCRIFPLQTLREPLSWPRLPRPRRLPARIRGVADRHAGVAAARMAERRAGHGRGSWDAHSRRSPSPGSRAVSRSSGSSTRASTPAAGRWRSAEGLGSPYSLAAACIGLGYSLPRQGRSRRGEPRARAGLQRRP